MIHDVLIALQDNLASQIALRYAEQMETALRFNMQAVHIPDLNGQGRPPASGWVRKKWENAVSEESQEGISDLIRDEYFYRFSDADLKIISGQRDQAILGELEEKPYDFLIEGQLHAFAPDRFLDKLGSHLYQNLSCPVLLVKNMVKPDLGTLILIDADAPMPKASKWLTRLLNSLPGSLDILICRFDSKADKSQAFIVDETDISAVRASLPGEWDHIDQVQTVRGRAENMSQLVRDYALVVAVLPGGGQLPLARMLAAVPSAILLCPADKPDEEKEGNHENSIRS